MGVSTAPAMQDGLLKALAAGTPVAVVQNASLAHERRWFGTLADLAAGMQREALGSPAIVIVGDVLQGLHHADAALQPPTEQAA